MQSRKDLASLRDIKEKNEKEDKEQMGFRAAKISFDGSHYIATPKENFPRGKKRRRSSRPASEQETERKEQFETAYRKVNSCPARTERVRKESTERNDTR